MPPPIPARDVESSSTPAIVRRRKDVGGWLALFCVATTIITPIASLVRIFQDLIAPDWDDLITLAFALFSGYVGINVWMVNKSAFTLLKVYFIFLLVIGGLVVAATLFFWWGGEELSAKNMIVGLRPMLFVLIWWPYFNMSKRVKETFGANL